MVVSLSVAAPAPLACDGPDGLDGPGGGGSPGRPGPLGRPLQSGYTLRLDELEVLRHRLVVDYPGLRLFVLERREGLEALEHSLGASLPFAALGPLALRGLWRKIHNPLAHGPASAVHQEAAGLRLDASLAGASRRGASLALPADLTPGLSGGIMITESAAIALQAGGWVGWRAPGALRVEALAVRSLPPPDPEQSQWILDRAPYPGGGLVHAAAGLLVDSRPASLAWAGALSGGRLVAPGVFSDLRLCLAGHGARLTVLGGVCSSGYRRPDGQENRRLAHGAIRAELTDTGASRAIRRVSARPADPAASRWSVEAEIGTAADRLSPDFSPGGRGSELEHWLSAAAVLERRSAGGVRLRLRGEASGQVAFRSCGGVEERRSLGVSVRAERGRGALEAELGMGLSEPGKASRSLNLRGRRLHRQGEESLRLAARMHRPSGTTDSGERALGLSLRGEVKREAWTVFLDLHTRKELVLDAGSLSTVAPPRSVSVPERLGLTLGWDVRVR